MHYRYLALICEHPKHVERQHPYHNLRADRIRGVLDHLGSLSAHPAREVQEAVFRLVRRMRHRHGCHDDLVAVCRQGGRSGIPSGPDSLFILEVECLVADAGRYQPGHWWQVRGYDKQQRLLEICDEKARLHCRHAERLLARGNPRVFRRLGDYSCLSEDLRGGVLEPTRSADGHDGPYVSNPPPILDIFADIFSDGKGSSAARAGVFFAALAFAFASMFENVCSNSVAGGIDLSGLFPRYIDIRRGSLITFFAVWIIQPWQLVNKAATFVSVLNSFSVFLAPIMGVMVCDYFLLRNQKVRFSSLFHPEGSDYWYSYGFNLRVLPCWIVGWAPTIGGLIATAGSVSAPRAIYELYYMAFFIGFFISFTTFYVVNFFFPPENLGVYDEVDNYGTFTATEAARLGIVPTDAGNDTAIYDFKNGRAEVLVADGSDESGIERKPWWDIMKRT